MTSQQYKTRNEAVLDREGVHRGDAISMVAQELDRPPSGVSEVRLPA